MIIIYLINNNIHMKNIIDLQQFKPIKSSFTF